MLDTYARMPHQDKIFSCRVQRKWNADDADVADFRGFFCKCKPFFTINRNEIL